MTKKLNKPQIVIERVDMTLEKVPFLTVFKQGDMIKLKTTKNTTNYELYGFLKTFVKILGNNLHQDMINCNKDYDGDVDDFEFGE